MIWKAIHACIAVALAVWSFPAMAIFLSTDPAPPTTTLAATSTAASTPTTIPIDSLTRMANTYVKVVPRTAPALIKVWRWRK